MKQRFSFRKKESGLSRLEEPARQPRQRYTKPRGIHMAAPISGKENWNFYSSAETCPLWAFVDCQTTGACESLTTYGHPPAMELQRAFLKIYSEFCEISKETAVLGHFVSLAQVAVMEAKITTVQVLINALFDSPSQVLVDALASWVKRKVAFDPKNPKSIFPELVKIESQLKTDVVRLRALRAEAENVEGGTDRPTKADFETILINLSANSGYSITLENLTVQQYALHIARARTLKTPK